MSKIAFITGITGQDGAYLTRFLLGEGYRVHGLVRWDSFANVDDALARLISLGITRDDVVLHNGDVTDANNLNFILSEVRPDEVYNLAGLSQVHVSFETPASTLDINVKGTLNVLDGLRVAGFVQKGVRLYQASSSEMFGLSPAPQNEDTPMEPCSPYGVAKLAAYHLIRTYRSSYGVFAANGILFNHESPLRGEDFVTRKIARTVAEIEMGRSEPLRLGNLESVRDWGSAVDYVEGMWRILQHDEAGDWVLGTGEAHSVRAFVERAFSHIGLSLDWQGSGAEECGVDVKTGRVLVVVDPALYRPSEVHHLLADPRKAREGLRWSPKVGFDALVGEMVNADRALLRDGNAACLTAV